MLRPRSCDTFAVLPPGTEGGYVVFGKNSDRPHEEVQEVVYNPAADYTIPCELKCTHIEIDQVAHTYATILNKPAWMWGAEMGANEHSVCIGNEAVWTKLACGKEKDKDDDDDSKLIGPDLLRLGLERAHTAYVALNVMVTLIKQHGIGGICSDTLEDFTYHNSFLIADPSEVWVLECAGEKWAAERVTSGVRNISNCLTIGTNFELYTDDLYLFAIHNGFWERDKGPLNFKIAFDDEREPYQYTCGKRLLTEYSKNGQFKEKDMFNILRDKDSDICMSSGAFITTGSQVSVLRKRMSGVPSCHWFTGTPDPSRSIFKPFIFSEHIEFPPYTVSPIEEDNNEELIVDRRHHLHISHEKFYARTVRDWTDEINAMESNYIQSVNEIVKNFHSKKVEAGKLFKNAIEEELQLYI